MATFTPRFAKKLILCASLVFSVFLSKAQTPYNVQPIAYNPYPYIGTAFITGDDVYSSPLPIGFTFNFFGANYTELLVSGNGMLSFDLSLSQGYAPWAINSTITGLPMGCRNTIMAPLQDLNNSIGGQIYYATYGTAPTRVFVVSYYNIPMYSCSNLTYTGQVVLHETSNNIDIFIEDKNTCSWNGGYAIQGLLSPSGTEGYVVPDRDYPEIWVAGGDAWRFEYCSALYNDTIKGRVYVDLNNNCIFDGNDYGLYNRRVSSNNACADAYTDADGFYVLKTEQGICNVTHTLAPGVLPGCPGNNINVVNFSGPNMLEDNVDFADTVIDHCSDVNLNIATWLVRPCSTSVYTFAYNNPTPIATGPMTLTVTIPDSFSYVSSSITPSSIVGNVYTFPLPAMSQYSSASMTVTLLVDCDVTVGSIKTVAGYIDNPGDCDTSNNDDTENSTVVNSCDPNNIIVASDDLNFVYGEQISSGDSLTYHINFQNTGTADAIHVIIKDTLPNSINFTSVETIVSSHSYVFSNDNGRLTFSFMNINLPDSNANEPASHGFVRFKVKQTPGNNMGLLIPNTAHIYFDNNAAVVTNTATDTISVLSVKNIYANADVTLYPNPATNMVTLEYPQATGAETISIYDQIGRVVYTSPIDRKHIISTTNWAKGVYLVRVNNDGRAIAAKLLVVQ